VARCCAAQSHGGCAGNSRAAKASLLRAYVRVLPHEENADLGLRFAIRSAHLSFLGLLMRISPHNKEKRSVDSCPINRRFSFYG
jgi:hypothetical protein